MKSPPCTHTHQRLSNNTNCVIGNTWFGGFQDDKQNKYPFLMDRFSLFPFIFMVPLVMVLTFCSSMLFIFFPILWTRQNLDHPQEE
jgi:hypothetical protein